MFNYLYFTPFFIIIQFIAILIYFKIADKYQIIDKPNARSSHSQITLRGGGILFPISMLLYLGFYADEFNKSIFFGIIATLALALVSFWDDIQSLSTKIRFAIQFLAISLLFYALDIFHLAPIWLIPIAYILVIGINNAYNFMDGINGITGVYSLVTLATLYYLNNRISFASQHLIYIMILACLVFLYFNFRKKAVCFAGDVGSVSIGFFIIWLLIALFIKTAQWHYILFLAVYGVDAVLTIFHRLYLKENILDAHRMHFYQKMANERKMPHLSIATFYGLTQLLINIFIIWSPFSSWITVILVLLPLITLYILGKKWMNVNG